MTPRSDINLGDLARVLRVTAPASAEDLEAVGRALGFAFASTGAMHVPPDPAVPQPATKRATPDEAGASEPRVEDTLPLLSITAVEPRSASQRPWELAVGDLLEPFDETVHLAGIAQHEPLLEPRMSRQILAGALATRQAHDELDAERAVETIASGRPLDPLPRRVRRSLSRGVQVLVDVGAGMVPYTRDAWEVVAAVERLVGQSRIQMHMFDAHVESDCGPGPIWTWRRYRAPDPAVPVLVLTDLGLSGGSASASAREDAWLKTASRLAASVSPLVFLTPYPRARWPARLAEAAVFLEWDRRTTVSTVHALRDALDAGSRTSR